MLNNTFERILNSKLKSKLFFLGLGTGLLLLSPWVLMLYARLYLPAAPVLYKSQIAFWRQAAQAQPIVLNLHNPLNDIVLSTDEDALPTDLVVRDAVIVIPPVALSAKSNPSYIAKLRGSNA